MKNNRVIVIGIDGGTFDIILPMVKKGELPTFKDIMDKGAWAELMSTHPAHTVPAWISCATGVNPGKLGLFDFRRDSHLTYDEGRVVLATDIKVKPIWSLLSENNKKVAVVAIPMTYPPVKVNGVMVSPVRLIEPDKIRTYPATLSEELVNKFDMTSALKKRKEFMEMHTSRVYSELEAFLDVTVESSRIIIEMLTDITLYLIDKYEIDFGMFMLPIDALQHHLWCFKETDHPSYNYDLAKKYKDMIFEGYKWVDRALQRILRKLDDDAIVIIVSDHGFGPLHQIFYLNKWLLNKGLLTLKEGKHYSLSISGVSINRLFRMIGLGFISNVLPDRIKSLTLPIIKKKIKQIPELIDWKYTKAYATSYAININLKGREPYGIVEHDEYKGLVEYIKDELYKLKKSDKEQQLIEKVVEKEELYSGDYLEDAPDILFFFKDPRYAIRKDPLYPRLFRQLTPEDRMTGHHTSFPKGICIMKGPCITPGARLKDPNIMDITPTVLYLMGESIPDRLDGRVITEVINPKYIETHPHAISSDKGSEISVKEPDKLSTEDEEVIKKRLSELGYMG
jgi:predicted AlkP superfamily phosphohydrolase/phosphomutase